MAGTAVIIDGNSIMYRSYFATQAKKDEEMAEQQFGLTLASIKTTIGKILGLGGPVDYAVVAFDSSKSNFRREKFGEYKSNRKPMPKPLLNNLEKIRDVFESSGISIVDAPANYEGDDAVATLATIFSGKGIETFVFSTDRDLLQLVSDEISVFLIRQPEWQKHTISNFPELNGGLQPHQISHQKALSGDSSDNYKGLSGIGPITSRGWLIKYGDIENIYRNVDSLKPSHKKTLLDNRRELELFLELSSLVRDVDISRDIEDYKYGGKNEAGGGAG